MKLSIEEILDKVEEFHYDNEICNFISSLNLTPEQMEILANHKNKYVKWGLAENPNLTEELMIKLVNDEDYNVKGRLARNLNLLNKIMIKLANDEKGDVRWELALNPNLTEKLMIKLSKDGYPLVRGGLLENPKITEKIIIKLTTDENRGVKDHAFYKLKNLDFLKKEELESVYDLIMESEYISRENFEKTFNYIADKFPELSELAKMFKKLIFKLKKDLR